MKTRVMVTVVVTWGQTKPSPSPCAHLKHEGAGVTPEPLQRRRGRLMARTMRFLRSPQTFIFTQGASRKLLWDKSSVKKQERYERNRSPGSPPSGHLCPPLSGLSVLALPSLPTSVCWGPQRAILERWGRGLFSSLLSLSKHRGPDGAPKRLRN